MRDFRSDVSHTEYINQWLYWSEDKRSSSGWYFKENEDEKYIVSYFPTKEDFKTIEYFDIIEACATFIKREIEDIRNSWTPQSSTLMVGLVGQLAGS